MNKLAALTLLAILSLCGKVIAQADYHSAENVLSFADYLYCSKDYLRAYLEYQSYLTKIDNDTVKYKSALSLQHIERYGESEQAFKNLFSSSLKAEAAAGYYKSIFFSGDYGRFNAEFKESDTKDSGLYKKLRLLNLSAIMLKGSLPDETEVREASSQSLQAFYNRKKNMPYRSPTAAGIMSAIIPGSGKFYTGEIGDGIVSLLATSLFAYLSYDNFNKDRNARGWIFAGLTGFFYAGNVYGSAQSALIYNVKVQAKFETDLLNLLKKADYFLPDAGFICP